MTQRFRVYCIGFEPPFSLSYSEREQLMAGADVRAVVRSGMRVGQRFLTRELDLGPRLVRGPEMPTYVRCIATESGGKIAIVETEDRS